MNSGTCASVTTTFNCTCTADFTGERCESFIDPCNDNPCQYGGTCARINSTAFSCVCPIEFGGDRCQDDVDECAAPQNACLNGGTCVNAVGNYSCQCGNNWAGPTCDECRIENCRDCLTRLDVPCTECDSGFVLDAAMNCCKKINNLISNNNYPYFNVHPIVEVIPCVPPCVNGSCIGGNCICHDSFVGIACSG